MKIVINNNSSNYGWTTPLAAKIYEKLSGKKLKKVEDLTFFDDVDEINEEAYYAPEPVDPTWVEVVEILEDAASNDFSTYLIIDFDEKNFYYDFTEEDGRKTICFLPIINITKIMKMNKEEIKQYLNFLNINYKGE